VAETGYLCDGPEQMVVGVSRPAKDESPRIDMAGPAREGVGVPIVRSRAATVQVV